MKIIKLMLVAVFMMVTVRAGWHFQTGETSCCHVATAQAQTQGPEQSQDEPEGNPTHDPNKAECTTAPRDGKMIACECHKWRNCASGQEPKSCSNFCYKSKCKCKKPCE
ncbi:MAG: hypothetical protein U0Y68_24760 [Blastocatellia bacterium]